MQGEEASAIENKDEHIWNVLLFAIKYDQTSIVEYLLTTKCYEKLIDPLSI